MYEEAQKGRDQAAIDQLLEVMGGGTPPRSTPRPSSKSGTSRSIQPFNEPSAPARGGQAADRIRSKLMQRGLPKHVADGFVMNFVDESNLNPGINEANPIVPGSRGGFGLSQWTGPRRKQLEAFAASRGVPVSDEDMQLDFLMQELGSTEVNAAKAIFGTDSSGEAAAAIVNKFLRPAEEHRARREARYLGGNTDLASLMSGTSQPQMSQGNMRELMGLMMSDDISDPIRELAGTMVSQGIQSGQGMSAKDRIDLLRSRVELEKAMAPPKESAAEAEIERLKNIGVPHDIAVKINSRAYRQITDPTTRETSVVDMGTGQIVYTMGQEGAQSAPQTDERAPTAPKSVKRRNASR